MLFVSIFKFYTKALLKVVKPKYIVVLFYTVIVIYIRHFHLFELVLLYISIMKTSLILLFNYYIINNF